MYNCVSDGCLRRATHTVEYPAYSMSFQFCDECLNLLKSLVGSRFGNIEKIRTDLPTKPGCYWATEKSGERIIVEACGRENITSIFVLGSEEDLKPEDFSNYVAVAPEKPPIRIPVYAESIDLSEGPQVLTQVHNVGQSPILISSIQLGRFIWQFPQMAVLHRNAGNKLTVELEIIDRQRGYARLFLENQNVSTSSK